MAEKKKTAQVAIDETAEIEITLTKPFVCYPDGFTALHLAAGKQTVNGRVAKLAKDCGIVK